jgi:hypothetical protein
MSPMGVQDTKPSSSSAPPPRNDRMGIQHTGERPIAQFNMLISREIKSTKWACPTTFNQLGITNDFNLLWNRVGLSLFVFQDVPTYQRLTLELLSTHASMEWSTRDREGEIPFHETGLWLELYRLMQMLRVCQQLCPRPLVKWHAKSFSPWAFPFHGSL